LSDKATFFVCIYFSLYLSYYSSGDEMNKQDCSLVFFKIIV